jgi:hypothetical protein
MQKRRISVSSLEPLAVRSVSSSSDFVPIATTPGMSSRAATTSCVKSASAIVLRSRSIVAFAEEAATLGTGTL